MTEEYDDAAASLHGITTLDEGFIRRTDLRWAYHEFAAEPLRSEGLAVGRIDGRFTVRPESLQSSDSFDDPSIRAITGPYAAVMNHYVRAEPGHENDLPYEIPTARVHPWSHRTFEGAPVDVSGVPLTPSPRGRPHDEPPCGGSGRTTPGSPGVRHGATVGGLIISTMRNAAPAAVHPLPQEPAMLKRILWTLVPIIVTRVMNKRRDGQQQPRADKQRFNRNGR